MLNVVDEVGFQSLLPRKGTETPNNLHFRSLSKWFPKPITPQGDWNIFASIHPLFLAFSFQSLLPRKGTETALNNNVTIDQLIAFPKPITPQGDWNFFQKILIKRSLLCFQSLLPRKGTETCLTFDFLLFFLCFQSLLPRKGTETHRWISSFLTLLQVSKAYYPARGLKQCVITTDIEVVLTVSKAYYPARGLKHPQVVIELLTTERFPKPITPQGDWNAISSQDWGQV